ncbi:MAG: GcrA cell cycle regulator [Methylobacteriaceae bacterium]|nr:GcrA cell cycle regulator [Methylobacteriaceae bacterium]
MNDTGATWTEERIELLTRLWAEGLSASRIANEIGDGVTRNAVIGKVHRMGLAGRAKKKGSSTPRPRRKSADGSRRSPKTSFREHNETTRSSDRSPWSRPYDSYAAATMPECTRVTILELTDSMCRWPLGDPLTPEFRYCGGDAVDGLPYCPYHCSIAYQPAQERANLRRTA